MATLQTTFKFTDFDRWSLGQLRKVRQEMRDVLSEEIHKRDAIKAEILYLQTQIKTFQDSH